MGKHGKKQTLNHRREKRTSYTVQDDGDELGLHEYSLSPQPSSSREAAPSDSDQESQEENEESQDKGEDDKGTDDGLPSKYSLYQQSVQSPKGDISYLQKFFLMYVGGRAPLHLQEDFCGTALLSVEWLHGDARRTAIGLDLDVEALNWCLTNNVNRIGADVSSRLSLLHGNVLQPHESKLVNVNPLADMQNLTLKDNEDGSVHDGKYCKDMQLPERDIVCAFNYSCCCLHNRKELILYFKHVLNALSKKGGIFVMDLYGGSSSEGVLRLQRRFPNFTYIWEQAEFDIIQRKTRISLHFNLQKQHRKIRHAFSYSWRLWSLPEIKDCLEEAGFSSVHFWIREMPNSKEMRCTDGLSVGQDVKYEEATSFEQQDSWNAYIVGVA
ncbi:S-adenosyl-L-methionine-dependentmethyltransferases superfamily protein [Striga asiatica]|uniref:S-adenosyl-L-methionine-dependentmethyltransferases superfamily protein n=1 Tax=Striga asiatica TaxID=4170 RepID=A0A5A7PWR8_STRAF|nr:S-adenosyl-L-methionine-dependentmethyltransferases superfamily protein [Striga asiatica]